MESADTVYDSLVIFREIIKTVKFNTKNMSAKLEDDSIYATDIATYLVKKHVPFRKSHEIVGNIVNYAEENKRKLSKLSIKEYKDICDLIEDDIFDLFNPLTSINLKKSYGGTAPNRIKAVINDYEEEIKRNRKSLDRLK